ncbi:hypothetical protein H9P43_006579 [Blastocladiella emersonii ATCC 22665]|nr:hypothetical protein H9P43_006579 [Blastocladiella emersonii ATCC 22665]
MCLNSRTLDCRRCRDARAKAKKAFEELIKKELKAAIEAGDIQADGPKAFAIAMLLHPQYDSEDDVDIAGVALGTKLITGGKRASRSAPSSSPCEFGKKAGVDHSAASTKFAAEYMANVNLCNVRRAVQILGGNPHHRVAIKLALTEDLKIDVTAENLRVIGEIGLSPTRAAAVVQTLINNPPVAQTKDVAAAHVASSPLARSTTKEHNITPDNITPVDAFLHLLDLNGSPESAVCNLVEMVDDDGRLHDHDGIFVAVGPKLFDGTTARAIESKLRRDKPEGSFAIIPHTHMYPRVSDIQIVARKNGQYYDIGANLYRFSSPQFMQHCWVHARFVKDCGPCGGPNCRGDGMCLTKVPKQRLNIGFAEIDGFCADCDATADPEQAVHKWCCAKERAVVKYVLDHVDKRHPHLKVIRNEAVGVFQCRKRPDLRLEPTGFALVVEADENKHQSYNAWHEILRVFLTHSSLGVPTVVIRVNTDAYRAADGSKVKSSFTGELDKDGFPVVAQELKTEWNVRLARLIERIEAVLAAGRPVARVTIKGFGYDCDTGAGNGAILAVHDDGSIVHSTPGHGAVAKTISRVSSNTATPVQHPMLKTNKTPASGSMASPDLKRNSDTESLTGGKGEVRLVREEDEYFDISQIKHLRWDEYQAEVMDSQSQASRMTDLERERELREMREMQQLAAMNGGGRPMSILDGGVGMGGGGGGRPTSMNGRPTSMGSSRSLSCPARPTCCRKDLISMTIASLS